MENFLIKLLDWIWDLAERYVLFWVIVREYESGVVLLLGKYHYTLNKGFNWKLPLLHESLTCLIKPETMETKPFTVTTKDHQTVTMTLIGKFEVIDAKKFLLEANDATSNIYHHLLSTASDYITGYEMEKLKKETAYTPIKKELNKQVEYMGVEFKDVSYGSICKTRPFSLINH